MKLRILLVGVATVVAMAFGASSALAVTADPPGTYNPTSTSVNFKVGSLNFTCTSSRLPVGVGQDGVLHGLTPYFGGCQSAFGATTVTPITSKGPIRYEMAFDQNGLNTTVGNLNLAFSTAGENCRFNVTGSESTTNLGHSPLTLSELVFPNVANAPATMTLSSFPTGETNHCFGQLALNSPVTFTANYKLSPALTITK